MTAPLLHCQDLTIRYPDGHLAVTNASFSIAPGECVALVGQSGSGKTTIARAILGILPPGATVTGKLQISGADLTALDESGFRALRGREIGYVAQDPYQACDPLRPVHDHVVDAWQVHGLTSPEDVALERLDAVGIANASTAVWDYPHSWSGGMLQRASIVAARAHNPPLVVADEPTSALDAERADATIAALKTSGSAVLLISHDLPLVLRHADRIAVCRNGEIIEIGTADEIATSPKHGYTRDFVAAADTLSHKRQRATIDAAPLMRLHQVGRSYSRKTADTHAVRNANLELHPGEIVGISGPSGCGKSTLLRLLGGIERPTAGTIVRHDSLTFPGSIMPIFQDPVASLNARWPVWRSVTEPLTARHLPGLSRATLRDRAREIFARVGLGHTDIDCLPSELSTGQCQRVSIARASIGKPVMIVADEPTSALDTLATAQILDLLDSVAATGTIIVMVSHDRPLLNGFAHRVIDMRDGIIAQATP
ncbi:ATP-binding cassette domain-containing protein [Devosia sp. 2618]|uniref:ABC transporter ATP-binding protein n=1 Tax=Devosia sp. 2618 TaxID=3156454 RepID=UPI0033918989